MMVDNPGWGEIGVYGGGILCGTETPPRLDGRGDVTLIATGVKARRTKYWRERAMIFDRLRERN